VQDAVNKIRGPKGTKVTLTILHESTSKPVDIAIQRDTITIPSVVSWIKTPAEITEISSATEAAAFRSNPKSVAYIQLSRFGDNTNTDWTKAVNDIATFKRGHEVAGLILDMRNNPGGYLEGSVFVASEFIKSGVVVSQKNSDGTIEEYKVNRAGSLLDIPMVVLVNKGSASAAEIVTGALRDYKRATVVGDVTFGKGTVQTPFDLSGGASVHITTGKWLLPKGDSISHKGITPDVQVSLGDSYSATSDAQLAKALELLLK
jgi:carboxyl-terminal processing protease